MRQISNPMASTDCTMLALAGVGHSTGRLFGFASCNRTVGASEGMNVLMHRRRRSGVGPHEYGVTNIEYTEFERLGISDVPTEVGGSESCFPANTNILYVGALPHAPCMLCVLGCEADICWAWCVCYVATRRTPPALLGHRGPI